MKYETLNKHLKRQARHLFKKQKQINPTINIYVYDLYINK